MSEVEEIEERKGRDREEHDDALNMSHFSIDPTNILQEQLYDVVIIGAGLSGLSSAENLLLAGSGNGNNNVSSSKSLMLESKPKVLVIEASGRVGGRMFTEKLDSNNNMYADLGATWIGPQQEKMIRLCERLDIDTVPQYVDGENVLIAKDGERKLYTGLIPPHNFITLLELQITLIWKIDRLANSVPIDNPTKCKYYRYYDALSVEAWAYKNFWTQSAIDTINLAVGTVFGCEASQISFLHFLSYVHKAGGINQLLDTRGAAQDRRLVGGSQQICLKLAENIKEMGGEILLNTKAIKVEAASPGPDVLVHYEGDHEISSKPIDVDDETNSASSSSINKKCFRARALIVACPPKLFSERVECIPSLPTIIKQSAEKSFNGCYSKAIVVYENAWWRYRGFSGYAVNTNPSVDACVNFLVDYCDENTGFCALMAFFTGDIAVRVADLSEQERRDSVLRSILTMFPEYAYDVSSFIDYMDKEWIKDEFTKGCPVQSFPPGTYKNYSHEVLYNPLFLHINDITADIPLLFWASTEVSDSWSGYMEGAVNSGIRAANQVKRQVLNRIKLPYGGSIENCSFRLSQVL